MPFIPFGLTGRILITFWITLVVILMSLALLYKVVQDDRIHDFEIPPLKIMDTLTLKLLSEDYSQVRIWFQQQEPHEQDKIFIYKDHQEILQRPLPNSLKRVRKRLSKSRPFVHKRFLGKIMVGRKILLPSGEYVKVFMRLHYGNPHLRGIMTDSILPMILMAIFISGLISYILARYISRPIVLLRQATQDVGDGDLSIRIQDKIPARHGEAYLLAKDFDEMASRLERTISSHKHLLQDISHELRSPVARLQLALELAKKKLQLDDADTNIQRIEKETEQINNIITTLLSLPAYELEPQLGLQDSVDMNELLQSICEDLNFSQADKPISLNIELNEPVIMKANGQLLRSAIENVVKNAQHYHQGEQAIEVTLSRHEQTLILTCRDQGPGVEHSNLENIFKPFYRTSQARDRASGGHGLGLAISKRAIELHKGHIHAANQYPHGLLVTLTLPLSE